MSNTADEQSTTRATTGPAGGRWVLDPAHSSVLFRSKTFWGLANVKGEFGTISGEGEVLPGGTATGTLTVQAASLDTHHGKRDIHLRSDDFFGAEENPQVVFTARTIAPSAARDTAEVAGDLVVRGISRPLSFVAKLTEAGPEDVTLEAEFTVDRAEFGMTWNRMGMLTGPAVLTVTARYRHQAA